MFPTSGGPPDPGVIKQIVGPPQVTATLSNPATTSFLEAGVIAAAKRASSEPAKRTVNFLKLSHLPY